MNLADEFQQRDVRAASNVWPLHPNLPYSAHSGLLELAAPPAGAGLAPVRTRWHGDTLLRGPITEPALLTTHYRSIRQVHLYTQPSDKIQAPQMHV